MGEASVRQMADRVAALMEERLGIRGSTLADKLDSGGRRLPRRIRREAEYLAGAAGQAADPAQLAQLDHPRIARAYDACVTHLTRIGPLGRYRAALLALSGRLSVNLLILAAIVVAVLLWRGLI